MEEREKRKYLRIRFFKSFDESEYVLNFLLINYDARMYTEDPDLAKNLGLARQFYQHYVAASRVSSLEGLQILNWAPHLISVNEEVKVHMEYINTHKKLELCFVPLYSINSTYKCSYINARSLHKHMNNVCANHTLKSSDVIMVSETRLMVTDADVMWKVFKMFVTNFPFYSCVSRHKHAKPSSYSYLICNGIQLTSLSGFIVRL